MATLQPRVQAPGSVAKDAVFEIRTLISHPMETGLRHDDTGQVIPRKIINKITCSLNGSPVFSADLREAVAANPYLAFNMRATESGRLQFDWEEDGGAVFTVETQLVVQP